MLESLKPMGLVLSEKEFLASMTAREDTGLLTSGRFVREYVQLPKDKLSYGSLAGAFVHRDVVSQINNLSYTYDQLRAWFDALQDIWTREGVNPLESGIGKAVRHAVGIEERIGNMVRTSQIIYSHKTWIGNILSNFMFGSLAYGPTLFSPKKWPSIKLAFRTVAGAVGQAEDQLLEMAVQHGIVNGALFERAQDPSLRRALIALTNLDDKDAIVRRLGRLRQLQAGRAAHDVLNGNPREMSCRRTSRRTRASSCGGRD